MPDRSLFIINNSHLLNEDVEQACKSIQRQIDEHFYPVYGTRVVLKPVGAGPPAHSEWWIQLVNKSDQPGALGYHYMQGVPCGVVGIVTCEQDGIPWSSCLSHEVLELLADPWASICVQSGESMYAYEVCDAVEGQGYDIDGVMVENFIYPDWFRSGSEGPWDFLGKLEGPLQLLQGGYISYSVAGVWNQVNGEHTRNVKRYVTKESRRGRRGMMSMPVTQHFSLQEFACHDGTPYPVDSPDRGTGTWLIGRLKPLCGLLEKIRTKLGGPPISITSGYRTEEYNKAIGGAKHSQHSEGRAADIQVEGYTASQVHDAIQDLYKAGEIPSLGGLGLYPKWIHVDIRPHDGHLAQWNGSGVGSES